MKKILMLCFSVFCTNFIWSQTISINSPTSVEVGINNSFSFKFTPPSSSLYGNYNISHWEITSSNSNMNNSGNSYYNVYLSSGVPINTAQFSTISIPIKWEDNSNNTTDKLRIKVTYSLQQTAPGVGFGNWSQAVTAEYNITKSDGTYYPYYDITIFRVLPPTISSPTILNCSTNNVQICASNYGSANSFAWSITGGSIASGQGSSCITVTPSANDNVTTTCLAKRLSGLPTYTATTTATITRTPRSIAYVIADTKNWLGIGAGRSLSIVSQSGISSINWIAPGCTITGQGTLNATITPTSLITSGTLINVYASVTFTGGCIFNSPINAYTVFSNAAPPIPNGYITSTPDGGDVCTASSFFLDYIGTNTAYWPMSITPRVIFATGVKPIVKNVQVCFTNPFTGVKTCKNYGVLTPAPCTSARVASSQVITPKITIAPNPTTGSINVMLPETLSGNYQVFDQNNILVQEAKFDNQTELQIELANKLKSGIYILKVITETNTFTDKIILNK
jgi:hypothetical protein